MRTASKLLIFVIFSTTLLWSHVADSKPRSKHVKLVEFTKLTLSIVPDYGTLLVFPFVLDDGMEPVLQLHNTNKVAFTVEHAEGQYTVLVTANVPQQGGPLPDYRGLLYITVGGYNVAVELRSTNVVAKNYSDVIFNLSKKEREYLISEAVKRRTVALEKSYQDKLDNLDRLAEEKALQVVGQLVRDKPSSKNVKSDVDATLSHNVVLNVFADEWSLFNSFAILSFEVENKSPSAVNINDVHLMAISEDGQKNIFSTSSYECDGKLMGDALVHCSLSVLDTNVVNADELRLVLKTDRGEATLSW